MSHLVFDRLVVRTGTRVVGPVTATFGVGLHGLAFARLDDLETFERAISEGTPALEGRVRIEGADEPLPLVFLSDLLPLPEGLSLGRLASAIVGDRAAAALSRSGLEAGRATEDLSPFEAFAFAVALVGELPTAGGVVVPSPHELVPATHERESARLLRSLAAMGLPVVVLLAPGLRASRFVDDVISVDEGGHAGPVSSAASPEEAEQGLRVRGDGLDALAHHLVRAGFSVALDESASTLTLHAPKRHEAERALTEALAAHEGSIDEVGPCR